MMDLLNSLTHARWNVAMQTFGNNHASLIGLLVGWWIDGRPTSRYALEGGPSFGYRKGGIGGDICDALLCEDNTVRGIVEVEGTRGQQTASKMGRFFAAEVKHYETLEFGILLLYAYSAIGKGPDRRLPPALDPLTVAELLRVSATFPTKSLVLITVDKQFERPDSGIRLRSEYYFGRTCRITAYLFKGGREVGSSPLCE